MDRAVQGARRRSSSAWVREYYLRNIFPLVTPQAMDPAHPFPFVSNLSLNLLVSLRYENDSESLLARVKVPDRRRHVAVRAASARRARSSISPT